MSVLLKKTSFDTVSAQEVAEQIEAKKKCKEKLPTYYKTTNIYYPNKLHIEQTSSEITAAYKANLVSGKHLLDLTGGLGVDSYFFSKKVEGVWHCEIDQNLSQIAAYNFDILDAKNIRMISEDGLDFLSKVNQNFDWIFVDPSRRNEVKKKVFLLSDCLPDLTKHLPLIFKKTNHILIKTSPLLDLTVGIKELQFTKEIHVVAVHGEVKELLWTLEKDYLGEIVVKTMNHTHSDPWVFHVGFSEEKYANADLSEPLSFLYEPNAAILKSGAFKTIGNRFQLKKLHEHTHLYTSESQKSFPGRVFKIEDVMPYNKKNLLQIKGVKANISTRNFPESVVTIRKKYQIKDGGEMFLFFIKNYKEDYIVLKCSKAN